MKSTNRKRTLLVSASVILMCMTIIVGMTWALFTDTQTVTNHLKAGDLKITLERIGLTKNTLTAKGYLDEIVYSDDDAYEDFTNPSDENVFGLKKENGEIAEKIVPGSKFTSTMKISNLSDAAFKYWVKLELNVEGLTSAQIDELKLDEQLIVTVYTDKDGNGTIDTDDSDGTVESDSSLISNGLEVGNGIDRFIGTLGIGDSETFIVSVEFDDKEYRYENGVLTSDNDVAQMQDVKFDLVVYAVQETDAPRQNTTPTIP